MQHSFVTIAVPFESRHREAVEARLDRIGNPARDGFAERLDRAAFVHFMSIWLAPDSGGRSHIVMEVNADGPVGAVAEKLAATIGDEILEVLAAAEVAADAHSLPRLLKSHHRGVGQGWFDTPGVNFDGTPEMSVTQVREEAALARTIGDMLDQIREPTAMATLEAVRTRLWNDEGMKWAFAPAPAPFLRDRPDRGDVVTPILRSVATTFLWPFLILDLLVFAVLWVLVGTLAAGFAFALVATAVVLAIQLAAGAGLYRALRRAERTDVADDIAPDPDRVAQYMRREGHAVQSHLASSSEMKPGWLRLLTLRIGLWLAGTLAAHFSRPGFLAKTGVIHFARWILLPRTNQLLFTSNYDGVWESYLEDFIERASGGVTGIWSNTKGFPKTENLFGQGARDGDRLRRWSRRQQQTTWVWYSAYPELTLNRIRANAAIRQGIANARTEAEAADWLSSFGSAPRLATAIETPEVPTLVFGGLGFLRHSHAMAVRLPGDPRQGRAWLARIEGRLGYGDTRGRANLGVLALSHSGLAKLGVSDADLRTFPVAFQHGMAAEHRARVLGDIDGSAPETWLWGGPGSETDGLLILYEKGSEATPAEGEERLSETAEEIRQELRAFGGEPVHEIRLRPLPARGDGGSVTEPFGFVDGISQPLLRDTPQARRRARRHHVVEAGEIVLGYPDNLGYLPATPSVAAEHDPGRLLPDLGGDPFRPRPSYSPPASAVRRDLGRNGTYLVARQLAQSRPTFDAFIARAAEAIAGHPHVAGFEPEALRDWIAAKAVGRWQNGTTLVRHPRQPGSGGDAAKLENDFLLGQEDGSGLACPLGSHVRRANPRESFRPGDLEQLAISNRHRILRVGRPYDPPAEGEDGGILFACLNTDIERQFEFVQQTWLLGRSFHGLEREVDPVLGPPSGEGAFTIPTECGPIRLSGVPRMVATRGGGYFFVPGRKTLRYLHAGIADAAG